MTGRWTKRLELASYGHDTVTRSVFLRFNSASSANDESERFPDSASGNRFRRCKLINDGKTSYSSEPAYGGCMKFAKITFTVCVAALATMTVATLAQQKPYSNDLNENFKAPPADRDYIKREVMVPMRDGVKLFTVIWIPKEAHDAPIVLTRTCYDAAHRIGTDGAYRLIDALPFSDQDFVRAGYIRVYQD